MLSKINPTKTRAWTKLSNHYEAVKGTHMRDLFSSDEGRFDAYSIKLDGMLLDYSKNLITEETLNLLLELAEETKLSESIRNMFEGENINETEGRPVLHTALRDQSGSPVYAGEKDVMPEIREVLEKMEVFSDEIISGRYSGYTGKPVTDVVNIGIGGSDLGPRMVAEALRPYHTEGVRVHFVSNIDGAELGEVLKLIDPETTLFLIASKTFTTHETMKNAATAKEWFLEKAVDAEHVKKHFVALSSNESAVREFGIDTSNMFTFWEWVGGRFSLWSAIGLSICCCVGFRNYRELLRGAYRMDTHFAKAPFRENMPVIMALISLWYNNFFGSSSEAVFPYDHYMEMFPAYLQQVNMESNGKDVDRAKREVDYKTGPVVWGAPGTNGQHAFFQLLHQGTQFIPCDFIAPAKSHTNLSGHHDILLSNMFAQTRALMLGKTIEEVKEEMADARIDTENISEVSPYRVFKGNIPTNTILLNEVTPTTLGMLIALYEHKVFVQGVIWNIFSFDQWGVELGKQLAKEVLSSVSSREKVSEYDSSTNGLINTFIDNNEK